MAELTALRLHDNQSFPDQLGYAVHQTAVETMAHLKKDTSLTAYDEVRRSRKTVAWSTLVKNKC
eukprot:scaffold19604_cov60-Attheya_sp.AAC.2